jgi:polysaccharide deacetylase 2 family uncharacterized protein YibQ
MRYQPCTSISWPTFWLPALGMAFTCVLGFGVALSLTPVGPLAMHTLRFVCGWHHIAWQQQQLSQTVAVAFQAAGLPVAAHQRGKGIPQRRGREHWQRQTHIVQVPPEVSLGRCETILYDVTRRQFHLLLGRQKRQSATHTDVILTVGIAGVLTDIFVCTQPRVSAPVSPRYVQVAILIDDLGWDLKAAQTLLALEAPLSFAILPNAPYRMLIAKEAQHRGRDVLLHLPMEPYGYPDVDPGQPVLLSTMTTQELTTQIGAALQALPTAVGVNNHMGSKLTENREAMRVVMQQMKLYNLFFLDSRTTQHSLAYQVAREIGVPTAQRQVFLDHETDITEIHQQLRRLATLAHEQGSAIGIGHPYPETVRVLQATLPAIRQEGIDIVPVSHLVR